MPSNTQTDLLTLIQRKHGIDRAAARRVLTDLIDHHKRLSMRRIVGPDISNATGMRKVFKAPISTKSTKLYPYRRETTQNVGDHPYKRTQDSDLEAISSKLATITVEHPENGHSDEIEKPFRYSHFDQPKQRTKFIYIGDSKVLKDEFVRTCYEHGMTVSEIAHIVSASLPLKLAETKSQRYKRAYQQIYWLVRRS